MDQHDPEQRIAELQRQLAEHKRMAEPEAQRAEAVGQPPQMFGAHAAAPGEPIRALLSKFPPGWTKRQLAVDMSQDAVSVIDPKNGARIAAAQPAQVTATPAAFTASSKRDKIGMSMPVLIVRVPGLQPLTIGCYERIGHAWNTSPSNLRFWWRGKVPWVKAPSYVVSAMDWLALVERFGLLPYLQDKANAQPDGDGREWIASSQDLNAAAETGRDRPVARWVFMIVFVGLALTMFYFSAMRFYDYRVGTPTTATVSYCTTGKGSFCWGTWSVGGVSQAGKVPKASVGSQLDVHVTNGKAYTASSWHAAAVVGGVLLGIAIVVFFVESSRTGTLVGKP